MKTYRQIFLWLFFLPYLSFGGLLEFKGSYNGKNLFVENKFLDDFNHHCITNVYVNQKHLLDHPKESIIELDLSSFNIGDTLDIRIYHKTSCKPALVNKKDVEFLTNHFAFTNIRVTEDRIYWETKGEELIGKFALQQYINRVWKDVKFEKATGTLSVNSYSTAAHHLEGNNKYRVKYRTTSGLLAYSDEVSYLSKLSTVVFYPKRVVDFITFDSDDSRSVEFAVYTSDNVFLFEGEGVFIDCRQLPASEYYILKYENKEERFYKKEGEIDVSKGK